MTQTLIVGQGLAGSVLAWELAQRGHHVRIIDNGHRTSSSRVAAGMVNPVQGQRLNLAWRIEDCLPATLDFFARMEHEFGRTFFHQTPILRLVNNEKEAAFLEQRQADERFQPFLGSFEPPGSNAPLSDEFGGLKIFRSGYVEMNPLLDCLRDHFDSAGMLCAAEFVYEELELTDNGVRWRDESAERIIFAEGFRILENPWFKDFNFQPNKGQILTVSSDQAFPTHPINRSKWIIPQPDGTAWCGSTYGRGQTDFETTDEGCEEILSKVAATLPEHRLTVVNRRAGVRCSTGDHVPRAGFHPEHPRLGVFNGFGSKGNVFVPWLALQFTENLINGAPLPEECDFRQRPPYKKKK
ncbi:NAD(P)/FAD-dependent oxidoreductase [Cerasicoccus frondis]|uniref:NAD(P)/FAD-dependent oxidoreductase n=1 Tax=Cerasicoccus frondis TaxID=490090 RepID=UPI002852CCF7|nr:FAD-binding oxidoreductase [Cerasicoccus frondis]